jgi:NAD(P)H-nitrite reductase large subunit
MCADSIQIKVKSGAQIVSFEESGVRFDDGTALEADVVVFATGFEANMRLAVSRIVSADVAEKLDDCWKVDDEGQPRGAWKPLARELSLVKGGGLD